VNDSKRETQTSQILITIAAFVVVVAGMSAAKAILVPFLLSAFIAIISAPPLFWMQHKGLPKWLALLIVILGVFLIGLLVAGLVGSSVNNFLEDLPLYKEKITQQTASVMAWLDRVGMDTSALTLTKVLNPGAVMNLTAALLNDLGSALANAFLIVMTVIFILLEASTFPAKLAIISGDGESSLGGFGRFIGNVKQYMAIKTLISLVTGLLAVILLTVIGVDYPLLWVLLAFALNYVPSIGSIIAAVPPVMLAIIQLDPLSALFVAAGYLAINVLMGNVIEPRFMGRGLGLSTLVVFLSLIFWGWVLGPVGMLLAVPLTITAKIGLDTRDDTRWVAILLGPEIAPEHKGDKTEKTKE